MKWVVREKILTLDEAVGAFSTPLILPGIDPASSQVSRLKSIVRSLLGDELTSKSKKSKKKKRFSRKSSSSKGGKASSIMKKMSARIFDDDLDIDTAVATPQKAEKRKLLTTLTTSLTFKSVGMYHIKKKSY